MKVEQVMVVEKEVVEVQEDNMYIGYDIVLVEQAIDVGDSGNGGGD